MPLATPLDAATFHVTIKTLLRRVIIKHCFALANLAPRSECRHDACGYRQCVAPTAFISCDHDFCTHEIDVIPPLPAPLAPPHSCSVEQSIQHGSSVCVVANTAIRMPRRTLGGDDQPIDLVLRQCVSAHASATTRSGDRHPRIDTQSTLHDEPPTKLPAQTDSIPNCLRREFAAHAHRT